MEINLQPSGELLFHLPDNFCTIVFISFLNETGETYSSRIVLARGSDMKKLYSLLECLGNERLYELQLILSNVMFAGMNGSGNLVNTKNLS